MHIQISLGTKFQLKLTILLFWTKFAQKGCFRSKTKKVNTIIELCIFELAKVPKKNFRSKTEKLHLRVSPWSLLTILSFSARGPIGILMSLLLLVTETKEHTFCLSLPPPKWFQTSKNCNIINLD